MRFSYTKEALLGGWVMVVAAIALAARIPSGSGWMIFAGLALVPPVVMLSLWRRPAQTMSQRIDQGRR